MQPRSFVLILLVVVGCKRSERPSGRPPVTSGPVLAIFAGHRITAAELQRYFDEQSPFVQSHYHDEEGKKAILGTMIRTQLLADQAAKEGFDHDDEALTQLRKAMITGWKRAKLNAADGERSLSKAELRAYYEAHRHEYQGPDGGSFEASEQNLRSRLWEERKNKIYDDFVVAMTERAQVRIDDAELAKVNRGTPSDEVAQPALPRPPPPLEEQLRLPLPPYRQSPTDSVGPVVATFADHRITTAEFQRYFEEQSPFVRSHYQSEEAKKKVLEDLIQAQLLVDEALKGGFEHDQIALDRFRKSMIGAWMEERFKDDEGRRNLSEADLRAYYEAHRARFRQPERVRVRMIFFKASPSREAAVQAEAEEALRSLSQTKDSMAFSRLARTRSDDLASRVTGGDLDYRSHDELAKSYGETVAAAADSLAEPWDLSRVVPGIGGTYLLQLQARAPAVDRSFEASQDELRAQLWGERRDKLLDELSNTLMEQARIKIDEAELAKVKLNADKLSDETAQLATPTPPLPSEKLRTPLAPLREFPYTPQAGLANP